MHLFCICWQNRRPQSAHKKAAAGKPAAVKILSFPLRAEDVHQVPDVDAHGVP